MGQSRRLAIEATIRLWSARGQRPTWQPSAPRPHL